MSASTADATAQNATQTAAQPSTQASTQPSTQASTQASAQASLPSQARAPQDSSSASSARALVARYRSRSALAFDVVGFAAACPGCGDEAEWVQQREDTRVRTQISCPSADCPP